jgi:hypothetical protein
MFLERYWSFGILGNISNIVKMMEIRKFVFLKLYSRVKPANPLMIREYTFNFF